MRQRIPGKEGNDAERTLQSTSQRRRRIPLTDVRIVAQPAVDLSFSQRHRRGKKGKRKKAWSVKVKKRADGDGREG